MTGLMTGLIRYNIVNADEDVIGQVVAPTLEAAAKKVGVRFGSVSCFLRLDATTEPVLGRQTRYEEEWI